MADCWSAAPVEYGAANPDAAREWPTADLARRLDRALDVADDTIQRLTTSTERVDGLDGGAPDRLVIDTAILLREAVSVRKFLAPDIPVRARHLAHRLASYVRHSRVALEIVARPSFGREYVAAHLILSAFGVTDDQFDRVLVMAHESHRGTARERSGISPHDLEQAWIASLSGIPTISGDAVERTALHTGIDFVFGHRDDVRSLARGIMFATDFGRRAPRSIQGDRVSAMAESALAAALDDNDFPLMGELLLAWPLLHVAWTPVATIAFQILSRINAEGGLSYVMGTLCAGILRAKRSPFTLPPIGGGSVTRADALLRIAESEEHRPRWVDCVASLTSERRASCEGFMSDALLRRAMRRLDWETVRRVLFGVAAAETPLSAQVVAALPAALGVRS